MKLKALKTTLLISVFYSILNLAYAESVITPTDAKTPIDQEATEMSLSPSTSQEVSNEPKEQAPSNKIDSSIQLKNQPSAHLTFHMGLSAEGQNFIGGSIENHGKVAVHGGYLVVLPIDEKCNPLEPIMQSFGKIPAAEIISFRVPVNVSLSGYRLVGFNAYDDMGFPIESIDDTLKIISSRVQSERKTCESARKAS